MVLCCVPGCRIDSWKCDPSITFHDFPSSPDLAAKWIKQINSAVRVKPMWFPRGRPVVCSNHFLQTDFKPDSDALKPRCVPTVFGHKYIGPNAEVEENNTLYNENAKSPVIVKIKTPEGVIENNSDFVISDVHSVAQESLCSNGINSVNKTKNSDIFKKEIIKKILSPSNNVTLGKRNYENVTVQENVADPSRRIAPNVPSATAKRYKVHQSAAKLSSTSAANNLKKNSRKREKCNSDLIEIGPNTFLKINPDIIKVNKKLTPSGNTVLQFIMDQKLARSQPGDILPKVVQDISRMNDLNEDTDTADSPTPSVNNNRNDNNKTDNVEKEPVVQHILGHLVDTHVCKDSCSELKLTDDDTDKSKEEQTKRDISVSADANQTIPSLTDKTNSVENDGSVNTTQVSVSTATSDSSCVSKTPLVLSASDSNCIAKAPVLMTTNMPLSHILIEKPKYLLQMKQKSRQIASLKLKLSTLTKKIEELEDRCIVQERQLSYSFIKKLKTIRKNASKGDPCSTYILEQIRSYSGKSKMRWSDSTLTQCAIWCRKAPYAYEYFKKAEFFKLPCLGTVKRYMKKHPELKFQKKYNGPNDDDDSSSDFDFDQSDSGEDDNEESDSSNHNPMPCETILSVPSENVTNSENTNQEPILPAVNNTKCDDMNSVQTEITNAISEAPHELLVMQNCKNVQENEISERSEAVKSVESNSFPITVDGSSLEVQEIILPSGEVVQCYSSNIGNGSDVGNQYYIIPNIGDQNSVLDHEYSVVQTESLPVILQNLENSQVSMQQQEQLIFITNSSDHVECNETEVTSV